MKYGRNVSRLDRHSTMNLGIETSLKAIIQVIDAIVDLWSAEAQNSFIMQILLEFVEFQIVLSDFDFLTDRDILTICGADIPGCYQSLHEFYNLLNPMKDSELKHAEVMLARIRHHRLTITKIKKSLKPYSNSAQECRQGLRTLQAGRSVVRGAVSFQ